MTRRDFVVACLSVALTLGAVSAVVAALADPGASPAALVQAAGAAGSFACGVEDCARGK